MTLEQIQKRIEYWKKSSEHDYETMIGLFGIKRFSDSLFFGHIVLEKILKAVYVENIKQDASHIHDLTRIAELASIDLTEEERDFLDLINDFNIRTRYPDYKLEFYKKCSKAYTQKHLERIKVFYK